MVTSTPILGSVETKQLKLGKGRFFLGSPSATFDGTAKFDTSNPGATWEDLMCIGDNVQVNASAGMFQYKNAVPTVTKKKFVIGRDLVVSAEFDEFKSRVIQTALGLLAPINKLGATLMTVQGAPGPTASAFTVDVATGLNTGDEIVVAATSGALASSQNSGLVSSAAAAVAITLRQPLFVAPSAGWVAKKRISSKLVFGSSDVRSYPLLFVVDFVVDKKQFVMFFPTVSSAGTFNPDLGGGQSHAKIGISWDCHAVVDSDVADNVLAVTYLFEDEQ